MDTHLVDDDFEVVLHGVSGDVQGVGDAAGWFPAQDEGEAAVTEGLTELLCRATDQLGHAQPVHQPWNRQGMANNMVQPIPVLVRGT